MIYLFIKYGYGRMASSFEQLTNVYIERSANDVAISTNTKQYLYIIKALQYFIKWLYFNPNIIV